MASNGRMFRRRAAAVIPRPARRATASAAFRDAASTAAVPTLRTRQRSSPNATTRTQSGRFSIRAARVGLGT
jgi:hypothetical protein